MSRLSDSLYNEKNQEEILTNDFLPEDMEHKGMYQENKSVVLSRKVRIFIFTLFLLLSIVADLDDGLFSAFKSLLTKNSYVMDPDQFGGLASATSIGKLLGSVIFMVVINFKHRKFTLIITIILHGSSFLVYKLTTNFSIFFFARMFGAANKVCATVYRPVWIEQFGLSNYKSILFSLIQIMGSYGNAIGMNLGSLLFNEEDRWNLSFLIIAIMMGSIAFGFIICPGKYFYRSYMFLNNKIVDTDESDNEDSNNNTDGIELSSTKEKIDRVSVFVNYNKKEQKKKYKFEDLLRDLLLLIKDKIYVLSIIKRSTITFVFKIIHSYTKSYQTDKFKEEGGDNYILLFYNLSSLLFSALGGLLGGIITKKLGGYESTNSIYILFFSEIISSITIGFLAFSDNFYYYNINLCGFFFISSIGAPIIHGYLITTIPKTIKGIGVGVDMIVSTILGKLPSTSIYGVIECKFGGNIAWKACIPYFYFGTLITFLLCYFKIYQEKKIGTSEVNLPEQITNIAALGAGADGNDEVRVFMPVPKRCYSTYVHNINYKLPNLDSV